MQYVNPQPRRAGHPRPPCPPGAPAPGGPASPAPAQSRSPHLSRPMGAVRRFSTGSTAPPLTLPNACEVAATSGRPLLRLSAPLLSFPWPLIRGARRRVRPSARGGHAEAAYALVRLVRGVLSLPPGRKRGDPSDDCNLSVVFREFPGVCHEAGVECPHCPSHRQD